MADVDRISALVLEAQLRIFRLAERDHGLTLKAISLDSGIPYNTVRAYAGSGCEPAMMPVSALLKLVDVIPDYLLSYLVDPVGRQITPKETEEGDIDRLGCEAAGFNLDYVNAKADGNITHIERARLSARARRLGAAAERVRA